MEAMQPRFVFGCLSLPLPFLLRPQSNLRVFDSSKVTNDGRGLKKVTFKQSAGQWGGWLNAKSLSGKLMMQHYKTTGQDKKMKCRMSHLYYNQPMSVSATHSSWFCIDIHIFWSGIPYKITSLCCWIPFFLRGGGTVISQLGDGGESYHRFAGSEYIGTIPLQLEAGRHFVKRWKQIFNPSRWGAATPAAVVSKTHRKAE